MKYLIDKEKLEARIDELLAGDGRRQADNVEGIALCALRECLVPYEEKKEIPSILYGNGCGGTKDHRCMKCNGDGNTKLITFHGEYKIECPYCNGSGKEPRKEKCYHHHIVDGRCVRGCLDKQDTRTHAWETPVSKQTYYSQDAVRKMLEDLKMRDNLAGNSKEVQEDRRHMNANIDKKIAEL